MLLLELLFCSLRLSLYICCNVTLHLKRTLRNRKAKTATRLPNFKIIGSRQFTKSVVPPLEIQAKIVNIYNQAQETKSQKEAEAKAILESIDAYLLEKLGIILPEK
jgi:hypothetical protein